MKPSEFTRSDEISVHDDEETIIQIGLLTALEDVSAENMEKTQIIHDLLSMYDELETEKSRKKCTDK